MYSCDILESLLRGNQDSMCVYTKNICSMICPLLQSALAAPRLSAIFLQLGNQLFEDDKMMGEYNLSNFRCKLFEVS